MSQNHTEDIFREPVSGITDIEHPENDPDEHDHADDAEVIFHSNQPDPKQQAKAKLMGLAAAGGVGLLMASFVGYQVYSAMNKDAPAGNAYPASTQTVQNPYEPQAASPAPVATQVAHAPMAATAAPSNTQDVTARPDPALVEAQGDPQGSGPAITATAPAATAPVGDPYQPQSENTAVNESLAKADRRLGAIEARLSALDNKLAQQIDTAAKKAKVATPASNNVGNAEARPAAKKMASPKQSSSTNTKFHIVSTVSGQAWIEDAATGDIEIVQVGESLSDGTKVTAIDVVKGVVSTSRGNVVGK